MKLIIVYKILRKHNLTTVYITIYFDKIFFQNYIALFLINRYSMQYLNFLRKNNILIEKFQCQIFYGKNHYGN